MGTVKVPSAAVLKNRGVPVPVHKLEDGTGTAMKPPSRVFDDAAEPVTETLYVKMTNNALSDIEDKDFGFGSLEAWQVTLDQRAYNAMRITLAIIWGFDPRERADLLRVGAMMMDNEMDTYATAVGIAFMIANGLDPTQAGDLLELGIEAAGEKRQEILKRMESIITRAKAEDSKEGESTEDQPSDIPGTNGSESGADQDAVEVLTNSGV